MPRSITIMACPLWLCRHSVLLRRLRFLRRFHPPYHTSPCHRAFVLPLPLPRCLIYKQLPKYSNCGFGQKYRQDQSQLCKTMISQITLLLLCRPTHTLKHTPYVSQAKQSIPPLVSQWLHKLCSQGHQHVDFTVQGHDCLMLCVKDESTTRLGLNACRLDPALPN